MKNVRCRYCDVGTRGVPYDKENPNFLVCNGCGAEWEAARVEIELTKSECLAEEIMFEEWLNS